MLNRSSVRVFIRGARLSFPSLDRPRASTLDATGAEKYQATFLLEPDNPSVAKLREACTKVARQAFGDKADAVLRNPERLPVKRGDDKENVPEGYAGMLYIAARSKQAPELRDANPSIMIHGEQAIREKFVAGYKVNGFVDIFPYEVKAANGAVVKTGISAGLVSVQFAGYADTFSGRAATQASDYPDCSDEVGGEYTPTEAAKDNVADEDIPW